MKEKRLATKSPVFSYNNPFQATFYKMSRQPSVLRSVQMIRKLKSGKYRLYSEKKDPKTGKRRNLGTFNTREAAKKHEREVQFFKRKK
jgi:hypothetical protein